MFFEICAFRDFTQRRMEVYYGRFGTCLSHLQGSSSPANMVPVPCPKTSVRKYLPTPREVPKESRSQFHRGRRLKSRLVFPKRPDRLQDPHRLLFNECAGSFPGVKRPQHQVDHSPPSSAEVKNEWSYTSIFISAFRRGRGKLYLCGRLLKHIDMKMSRTTQF